MSADSSRRGFPALFPASPSRNTGGVRSLFRWLPARGWKRWLVLAVLAGASLVLAVVVLVVSVIVAWNKSPRFQMWAMEKMMSMGPVEPTDVPGNPGLRAVYSGPLASAEAVRRAADIFQPTNVWNLHFIFTAGQWERIHYKRVPPVPGLLRDDGSVAPEHQRFAQWPRRFPGL